MNVLSEVQEVPTMSNKKNSQWHSMDLFDEMAPHLDPNFIATIRKLFWQKRKLEKPRREFYMIFIVAPEISQVCWCNEGNGIHKLSLIREDVEKTTSANGLQRWLCRYNWLLLC
ncbi:hypothetical protein K7X08_017549 [Anisodus acutangulus]|uniref:Uncharacterized protein n=1 Tax=Anisodus acutangulus TaxID=402998 RepID=A0A9Q1R9N9_9SOLA|nr:hypothetical protein K7X08_017549 [Anisodus acutangulus]